MEIKMNVTKIMGQIGSMDNIDLQLFYCNLATGYVSNDEYERRLPIVNCIAGLVEKEADKRGIELPKGENAYHLSLDTGLSSEENMKKYLGVSWDQLH